MDLPFLGQIAGQGVLGLMLAVSLFFNWFFIQKLLNSYEKRIEDAKEISNKLLQPVEQIRQNGELLISLFNKFLSGSGKQ